MYPYIHLIIPSYALMALIGGIVAICYVYFNSEKEGVLFTDLLKTMLYGGIGLFLGSKLLFVITQIPWLVANFSIKNLLLLFPQSGYVFYGGLFGFIFALHIMSKGQAEFRRKLFSLIVPAFPLFHAFGRIGCFLTGCCYGKKLSSSLFVMNIEIDRIPVQLIEAMLEAVIFLVLCVVKKKKAEINLLAVYLNTYAILRFCLEFLRGDETRGIFGVLSTSQYISLFIVIFYVGKVVYFHIRDRRYLCR